MLCWALWLELCFSQNTDKIWAYAEGYVQLPALERVRKWRDGNTGNMGNPQHFKNFMPSCQHSKTTCLQQKGGRKRPKHLLFLFSHRTDWIDLKRVISRWLPINQSLIKPGWFLSVFTDNLTSVSVPCGQNSPSLKRPDHLRLGNLGES